LVKLARVLDILSKHFHGVMLVSATKMLYAYRQAVANGFANVTFVVQAKPAKPGDRHFRSQEATAKAAIKKATELLGKGMAEVMILDETDGWVYSASAQLTALFKKAP
jgi:hypothetical protein